MLSNTDALASLVEAAEGSLITAKARLAAAQQHKKELGDKVVAAVTDFTKGTATRGDMSAAVHELSDQQARADFRISQAKGNIARLEARITAFSDSIKAREAEAVVLTHLQLPDMAEAATKKLAEIRACIRVTDAVSVALLVQSGQAVSPVAEPGPTSCTPTNAGAPAPVKTQETKQDCFALANMVGQGAAAVLQQIASGGACPDDVIVHTVALGQRKLLVEFIMAGVPVSDRAVARVRSLGLTRDANYLQTQVGTAAWLRSVGLIK